MDRNLFSCIHFNVSLSIGVCYRNPIGQRCAYLIGYSRAWVASFGSGERTVRGIGRAIRTGTPRKMPRIRMYTVGQSAEMTKIITEEEVFLFPGVNADRKPVRI